MNTSSNPGHDFTAESSLPGKLAVLLGFTVLMVVTLMAYLIWSGYREAVQSAEITSRNYATIIEARLDDTLRRTDAHLQELVRELPMAALSKRAVPRYAHEVDAMLDLLLLNFPELGGLRVFDANGDLIYSSGSKTTPRTNIVDRSHFHLLRDNPQIGLLFSKAVVSRGTGRQTLGIARALRDAQGAFRGVVLGAIELEYFQKLFQSLDIGPHGVIAIRRSDDFTQVVRWPPLDSETNKALAPDRPIRQAITAGKRAATISVVNIDGVARILSFRKLEHFPFFVVSALGRKDVLAGWKERSLAVGLSALLLLGLLAGLLHRLWRTDSRQAQTAGDLVKSEYRHRDLMATMPGAMYEFHIDAAGRRSMPFISDGVTALTGLRPAEIMADVEVAFRQVPAAALPALEQSIRDSLEKLAPWLHEFPYRTTTGEDKWLRGHAIPRREADGATHWRGVFVDITDRKRAEESRARLAAIVEHASDAIIGRTLDGTITSWNAAAERLFGYTAMEAVGQPIVMLRAPGLPPLRSLPRNNERLLRGEYLPPVETKRVTKGGLIIDVLSSISPIKNETGDVIGVAVIVRDISERKTTEIALRLLSEDTAQLTGEAFFSEIVRQMTRLLDLEIGFIGRLLMPHSRIRTLGLCIDGQIVPAVEYDIAQTPCEAVIGRKTAIFPRNVQQLFPEDRTLVELGASGYGAVPLLNMKGLALGHIGVMSRAPLDAPERIEALLRLFAVRVAAEIERQETESKFQDLFEFSPDAILTVNEAGSIVLANHEAELAFGYSREELLGLSVEKLVPDAARRSHAGLRAAFSSQPMQRSMGEGQLDLRGQKKDGTTFPVTISLHPMHTADGKMVVATVRDITAQRQADAERQSLEEQLRQAHKMEAIGTLAGGIAHDFNNILASIIGNTELARQDVGPRHPALESLSEIGKASARARDLVQQILTFSRKQTPVIRAITLPPVIEEAVKLIRAALPAGIHLSTAISPEAADVRIQADPILLQQVMINLCSNAAHAMGGRLGRIDIRLERIDQIARKAQDAGPAAGRHLHLSVRDTGCGMDADTLKHIFDPFFTTKAVGEGTGLGLSVVHGIMQAHEGAISVDSRPGEGSTFHLYFPVADVAVTDEKPAAELPLPAAVAGRARHVLYVDDDGALVFMLTRLLERQGYRVSGHTSAGKALEVLRANPRSFDLVVTDYNMPEMSGLDLAREIHAIRPDLPVALTSGYITDELRQKSADSGLSTLIYKPNTVDELCEAVHLLTNG